MRSRIYFICAIALLSVTAVACTLEEGDNYHYRVPSDADKARAFESNLRGVVMDHFQFTDIALLLNEYLNLQDEAQLEFKHQYLRNWSMNQYGELWEVIVANDSYTIKTNNSQLENSEWTLARLNTFYNSGAQTPVYDSCYIEGLGDNTFQIRFRNVAAQIDHDAVFGHSSHRITAYRHQTTPEYDYRCTGTGQYNVYQYGALRGEPIYVEYELDDVSIEYTTPYYGVKLRKFTQGKIGLSSYYKVKDKTDVMNIKYEKDGLTIKTIINHNGKETVW